MASHDETRTIPASIDTIWGILAPFGDLALWVHDFDHSWLISDEISGIGMMRRVQAGPVVVIETVDYWDPPRGLGYRIEGLPAIAGRIHNQWALHPADKGSTTVTITTTIEPARGVGRVIAPLLLRRLRGASVTMLDALGTRLGH